METVVERLVMSKQQFKFHSQAFELAVFETIKFRYQPNRFHVNGKSFLVFDLNCSNCPKTTFKTME